jgi:hypothetical protein
VACYKHPLFIRNRPELMEQIKRKTASPAPGDLHGQPKKRRKSGGSSGDDDDARSNEKLLARLEVLERSNYSLENGNK